MVLLLRLLYVSRLCYSWTPLIYLFCLDYANMSYIVFICAFPLWNYSAVIFLLVFSGLCGISCSCIVNSFSTWSQVSRDSIVECLPDYIVYRDKYSTDSVVTFSSSFIKIEGYWQAETFEFQWGVDHIMNIECQWCERVSYFSYLIVGLFLSPWHQNLTLLVSWFLLARVGNCKNYSQFKRNNTNWRHAGPSRFGNATLSFVFLCIKSSLWLGF